MIKAASVVALCALLVACGSANKSPDPTVGSEPRASGAKSGDSALLNDFRFRWSADPGIDLVSGVAIPLRAYLESYNVASYALDPGRVYPGFMQATPENEALDGDYASQLAWIRPLNGVRTDEQPAKHFGYAPFHILRIDPVENGLRATVCEGTYANFVKSRFRPDEYVSVAADLKTGVPVRPGDLIAVHRVELTENDPRAATDPPVVTVPQQGPKAEPQTNVFGKWFITGASTSYWGLIDGPQREEVATPELRQACADRMPEAEDVQLQMATGFKSTPPAAGNAVPGWPE